MPSWRRLLLQATLRPDFLGARQRRQQHGGQNRNDHQQLDQREAPLQRFDE